LIVALDSLFASMTLTLHKNHVHCSGVGLSDAFYKNTSHLDLSTVADLSSCVAFRTRHSENRSAISIVKPQL